MQFRQAITTTLLAALVGVGALAAPALAQPVPDPNSARPRMLTPAIPFLRGSPFQIYQNSPDGSRLRVRVDGGSFTANGMGAMLPSFIFAVQYSMQRWNEIGGAGLAWSGTTPRGTRSVSPAS